MQWVVMIWSMIAAACLTLAAMHFWIWLHLRQVWGHLLFTLSALGAAGVAAFELGTMLSQTPEAYAWNLRGAHVPLFILLVAIVWFVRVHLQAGREWLAWTIVATRVLALLINFFVGDNLNFTRVTAIRQVEFIAGQVVSVPEGVTSPWSVIAQLSTLLILVYLVDAFVQLLRRGDRLRSIVLCGSMATYVLLAGGHGALVTWGVVDTPFFITIPFVGIVLAMAYDLGMEVIQARGLQRQLEFNQTALTESEQRMEQAAAAAGLGAWTWDVVVDRMWMSDRCRELLAIPVAEEVSLDRCLAAMDSEDREATVHSIANAMNGDGDLHAEFRVPLARGGVRWISGRGSVEFSRAGRAIRLRGVLIDVTARKRAESEVQQQRTELAHLSRVTMLGELSGSLAHELNQPLTAILSNAEAAQRFLSQEPVNVEEVRAILKDIVDDDTRAGEVIRRLRLLLQKGELQRQPLDIGEVIRDVLRLMNSDLLNHGITVATDLDEHLPVVSGDRVQIQQVMLNLIMNASDVMAGNAPGTRRLSIHVASANGQGVSIKVSDQGPGIAAGNLEQVFTPFYTTKPTGMGLGLTVCRTIVGAHGGRLWATNNDDRGASFHVLIPSATPEHRV